MRLLGPERGSVVGTSMSLLPSGRMALRPDSIDGYLATLSEPHRAALEELRRRIRALVPDAEEVISYGIPAFRVKGGVVAGFCARAMGLSYFPFSGTTLRTLAADLRGYSHTKSALHFAAERPLPRTLVRKLLETRLAEMRLRAPRGRSLVPGGRSRKRAGRARGPARHRSRATT